jgi:GT2 family glycosyltransferase
LPDQNVAVLISTKGRPALVRDLVERLKKQTRPPDRIFIVGSHAHDLALLDRNDPTLTFFVGREGRGARLNDAMDAAGRDYRTLVFFDDDFLPSRFWIEQAEALLSSAPEVIAVTGAIVAGGFDTRGVDPIDAEAIIDVREGFPIEGPVLNSDFGLLGCNMAIRADGIEDLRMDESMPAGGLLADVDFCARIAKRGRVGRAPQMAGVKMDIKLRILDGREVGRAQMINAAYLARKGTFSHIFAVRFMARTFWANFLRAFAPESYIDRTGRMFGNMVGLFALLNPATLPRPDEQQAGATPARAPSKA